MGVGEAGRASPRPYKSTPAELKAGERERVVCEWVEEGEVEDGEVEDEEEGEEGEVVSFGHIERQVM